MALDVSTLPEGIRRSFAKNGSATALEVDGKSYSYAQMARRAYAVCHAIDRLEQTPGGFVAVFGHRTCGVYAGILGIVLSGNAYVPLNPHFPAERLKAMLTRSGCHTIVLYEECVDSFAGATAGAPSLTVICPEPGEGCRALSTLRPQHRYIFLDDGRPAEACGPITTPEMPAYLLFTSGSTGVPKGVAVTHQNVCAYLRTTIDRYQITSADRVTQMFDLTFDLSVHDIFVTFLSGACLCVVPESAVMGPARFIAEHACTVSFSVPSVAMFMARMRMLKPNRFPSLRLSLFCGEALPARSVELWQAAAPSAIIENLYGPTESTIAITNYRWEPTTSPSECVNGVVPIGWPYEGHRVRLLDEQGRTTTAGELGELLLAGPQVTCGYLHEPERTAERFVRLPDDPDTFWYKTGDLARQDARGCLFYLGRVDDQIKIRGYRIELQEIDRAIREAAGTDLALSVPFGLEQGRAESVSAFVQGGKDDVLAQKVIAHCRQILPEYMIPRDVRFVEQLPLNANGKINRKALMEAGGA